MKIFQGFPEEKGLFLLGILFYNRTALAKESHLGWKMAEWEESCTGFVRDVRRKNEGTTWFDNWLCPKADASIYSASLFK